MGGVHRACLGGYVAFCNCKFWVGDRGGLMLLALPLPQHHHLPLCRHPIRKTMHVYLYLSIYFTYYYILFSTSNVLRLEEQDLLLNDDLLEKRYIKMCPAEGKGCPRVWRFNILGTVLKEIISPLIFSREYFLIIFFIKLLILLIL